MYPIKRGILVVLLSLGAIGGFTSGFAHMSACHGGGCSARGPSAHDQFEEHIADVCTRAAQRVQDERDAQDTQAAPPDWREARPHHHHHGHGGPRWGPQQWGGPGAQYGAPPAPPSAADAPVE